MEPGQIQTLPDMETGESSGAKRKQSSVFLPNSATDKNPKGILKKQGSGGQEKPKVVPKPILKKVQSAKQLHEPQNIDATPEPGNSKSFFKTKDSGKFERKNSKTSNKSLTVEYQNVQEIQNIYKEYFSVNTHNPDSTESRQPQKPDA